MFVWNNVFLYPNDKIIIIMESSWEKFHIKQLCEPFFYILSMHVCCAFCMQRFGCMYPIELFRDLQKKKNKIKCFAVGCPRRFESFAFIIAHFQHSTVSQNQINHWTVRFEISLSIITERKNIQIIKMNIMNGPRKIWSIIKEIRNIHKNWDTLTPYK